MERINSFEKILGSGFYTGYIPFASGTFGSLVGLLIYCIPGFENIHVIIPAIIVFFVIGIQIGNKFEKVYGKDPAQCTIDEVMGMWISLLLVPKTILNMVLGFFIWRIFDIIKPYPARDLEKLDGGLGIMIDDFVAAIYSLILVHFLLFIINRMN
ncbi:MAG: phosphatidylglycerophosphatase A [Ignavibacteriales bacterium]|nr:phosphatidylglycerophosphatase A [Ignavibacteriales bacterium]